MHTIPNLVYSFLILKSKFFSFYTLNYWVFRRYSHTKQSKIAKSPIYSRFITYKQYITYTNTHYNAGFWSIITLCVILHKILFSIYTFEC